ncbi:hypothetical protein C1N71_11320 [Agrococcus sp. SGAir0287]|nr:hypothetical protein C1N71_11320 [Agrococcus sp. SGAir0287]
MAQARDRTGLGRSPVVPHPSASRGRCRCYSSALAASTCAVDAGHAIVGRVDRHDRDRDALLSALDAARTHVLDAVAGVDDATLRAATLPSGWSPIGLVRHLTLGGERYWFETVVAGGDLGWWPDDDAARDGGRPADWRVDDVEPTVEVLAAYRAAIARSGAVLASVSLDDAPRRREEGWGPQRFPDVRAVVLHVLVETATHAGHLDAALELGDGRQRLVL